MPVIITEIAIQADGRSAVELHNNGSALVDISAEVLSMNYGIATFPATIPAGTIIPAGGTLTVGHSSISGLDLTPNDTAFEPFVAGSELTAVFFGPFGNSLFAVDSAGVLGGASLGLDVVYEGSPSRTPDPDVNNDNTSDFTQTSGFSNNSLGIPCFLTGTLITTPDGEVAVEALQPGDLVRTADGRDVPVLWVGQKWVKKRIGDVPEAFEPVCINAGALGNHSDLYVTADHGMILQGMIVNAAALVNGDTICFVDYTAPYLVYHVETEHHEVLLANGAEAESYLPRSGRVEFDNAQEAQTRVIPEMDIPRVASKRQHQRLWAGRMR